jgi:hypothetical protein
VSNSLVRDCGAVLTVSSSIDCEVECIFDYSACKCAEATYKPDITFDAPRGNCKAPSNGGDCKCPKDNKPCNTCDRR